MIDIAVLRAMATAGATIEAILAAVEAEQKRDLEELATRKEKNRIRVKNQRSRARTVGHVQAPPPPPDGPLPPNPSPPLIPPAPSLAQKPKKVSSLAYADRKTRLPANFQLTVADHEYAQRHGWDAERRNREFERFCDHALSAGRIQVDWHASWRKWVTSPYGKVNANGHAKKSPSEFCFALAAEIRQAELDRAGAGPADAERGGGAGRPDDDGLFGWPGAGPAVRRNVG